MAADGLSNRDIGEKLYISRKTVAYHLNKTFAKLEVTSRGQLFAVLTTTSSQAS